jgi:hypothetical protein
VPVGGQFFLVASDEDNRLRLYRNDASGTPVQHYDLDTFLHPDPRSPEADIEGAALLGTRAYWVSSMGRNRAGRDRVSRHVFLATDLDLDTTPPGVRPVGRPYHWLLDDLLREPALAPLGLAAAIDRPAKHPQALNVEGLAAHAGGELLLGLRSPVLEGRAILIPLRNPEAVIRGNRARFGPPSRLDLGGLGILDLTFAAGVYYILAGDPESGGNERLFRWNGTSTPPTRIKVPDLKRFQPEAVIAYPGVADLQILSDDGSRSIDDARCKDLPDPAQRRFRSFWVRTDAP